MTSNTRVPGIKTYRNPFLRIGSRWSWTAMALLWSMFALNANMRSWVIGSLQPSIVAEFKVDAVTIGLFAGIITLAQGIIALPVANWTDRGGPGWIRKYRYAIVVALYVALSLLTGISWLTAGLWGVFVLQCLQKMFSGSGEAIEVTAVSEWWPVEKRGFAQGLHHTAYPWGTFIGGLIISAMLGAWGPENWRIVFLTLPLIAIPVFAMYWKFSSKKNYEAFSRDTEARGLTVPVGHGMGDAVAKAPAGAAKRALKNPNVMIISIVMGLALAGYTGISFWLPLYIVNVAKYSIADTAALAVVFTVTGGVGQIVWGAISDRLGRKLTILILCVWLAVGFVLLQFIGLGIFWLIALQLFIGLATNGIYPVLYAMAGDSIEAGAIGTAMGFNVAGQMLGGVGPIVIGFLIGGMGGFTNPAGYTASLWVLGGLMVLSAVLVLFFTRETVGWFEKRDKALVSTESCHQGPLHH